MYIGRYEIKGDLGHGGFGRVYRAYDPVVRREVAVKVLTAITDAHMRSRFAAEAGTTAKLNHRHIVTVYDFGEHDGRPFLVMELLEGQSLKSAIDSGARLPLFEKITILHQMAEALLAAHKHGVIHRDIKPGNIMLLPDGNIKVLDFGIARVIDETSPYSVSGLLMGTMEYMAPEVLDGQHADRLSDIFSYGVTGYELLAGIKPFRARQISALAVQIASLDPPPVSSRVTGVPATLDALVAKTLQKDRTKRYQSFEDVRRDLGPLLASLRDERTRSLMAEVRSYLAAGDVDRADALLSKVLDTDPGNADGQAARKEIQEERRRPRRLTRGLTEAEALRASGKLQEAEAILNGLASEFPEDSELLPLRGKVAAGLVAQREAERVAAVNAGIDSLIRNGSLQQARAVLDEALREIPPWQLARAESALAEAESESISAEFQALLAKRSFDEARALLRQVHRQLPSSAFAKLVSQLEVAQNRLGERGAPAVHRQRETPPEPGPSPKRRVEVPWRRPAIIAGILGLLAVGIYELWPVQTTGGDHSESKVANPAQLPIQKAPELPLTKQPSTIPAPTDPKEKKRADQEPGKQKDNPPPDLTAASKNRTHENHVDGLTYVFIPPGTFAMGCSPGDTDCFDDEKPPHVERIAKGFWLGQTEVTQAAWKKVVGANPSYFKGDRLPVETVDWNQASEYCKAIGGRLPTETEWEYAARAGTTAARYGGLDFVAWYSGNSGQTTHPVALKQANAFGLYDMLGNAWELTATDYDSKTKVLRGGSWYNFPRGVRASYRNWVGPEYRGGLVGFRCAGELP